MIKAKETKNPDDTEGGQRTTRAKEAGRRKGKELLDCLTVVIPAF